MRAWAVVLVAAAAACGRSPLAIEPPDQSAPADLGVNGPPDLAPVPLSFGPGVPYASAGGAGFITADLNGDGVLDLLGAGDPAQFELIELFGKSDGTFSQPPSRFQVPNARAGLIFATPDINKDKKVDAIAIYFDLGTQQHIGMLIGQGDGTFAPPQSLLVCDASGGYCYPTSFDGGDLTSDLNHDGRVDIVVGRQAWLTTPQGDHTPSQALATVLLGVAPASFSVGQTAPLSPLGAMGTALNPGDFDGDGNTDLLDVTSVGLQLALGNGDGTFQAPKTLGITSQSPSAGMIEGDFNGDGARDLLVGDVTLSFLAGHGDGTFAAPAPVMGGGPYPGLQGHDLNGDGNADFLAVPETVTAGTPLVVGLGVGDGTFVLSQVKVPGAPTAVQITDVDGDGKPDLIVNDGAGQLWVMRNLGG